MPRRFIVEKKFMKIGLSFERQSRMTQWSSSPFAKRATVSRQRHRELLSPEVVPPTKSTFSTSIVKSRIKPRRSKESDTEGRGRVQGTRWNNAKLGGLTARRACSVVNTKSPDGTLVYRRTQVSSQSFWSSMLPTAGGGGLQAFESRQFDQDGYNEKPAFPPPRRNRCFTSLRERTAATARSNFVGNNDFLDSISMTDRC